MHKFLSATQYLHEELDVSYFSVEQVEKRKRLLSIRTEKTTEEEAVFESIKEKSLSQLIQLQEKYPDDFELSKVTIDDLSDVTIEYLSDWDSLSMGVEANPDLEPILLRNILVAEKTFLESIGSRSSLVSFLKEKGITLIEFIETVQKYTEKALEKSTLFRATDVSVLLRHILPNDYRWKSQFETQTSGGHLGNSYRASYETKAFGYSIDSEYEPTARTIYGYFTPDTNGVLNNAGTNPPENSVYQYGRASCKIKDEAKRNTTFLFRDSLNADMPLAPAEKPHYLSSLNQGNVRGFWEAMMREFSAASLCAAVSGRYSETQIHGGLKMSDIESIHLSTNNGVSEREIKDMQIAVEEYNKNNPDNTIELVIY